MVSALTSLINTSQHLTPFSRSTSARFRSQRPNAATPTNGITRIASSIRFQYSCHIVPHRLSPHDTDARCKSQDSATSIRRATSDARASAWTASAEPAGARLLASKAAWRSLRARMARGASNRDAVSRPHWTSAQWRLPRFAALRCARGSSSPSTGAASSTARASNLDSSALQRRIPRLPARPGPPPASAATRPASVTAKCGVTITRPLTRRRPRQCRGGPAIGS